MAAPGGLRARKTGLQASWHGALSPSLDQQGEDALGWLHCSVLCGWLRAGTDLLSGLGGMRAPEVSDGFLLTSACACPTWVDVFDKQKSPMLCKPDECFLSYGQKVLMFESFL